MDISPAVVSRLVADLEDYLGTRLLHRSTRRLSLSAAGETYLSRVRAILQDIDEAHRVASSHTHELDGVLHVLAPPVLASHVLAPLIAGFRQFYPKILLNIEVASFKEPPIVAVEPGLWINHTDTLLRAALDGAGITSVAMDLVALNLSRGELVRVLRPWITGRLTLYAALPSRKFMPERTRVFLEYLTQQTRLQINQAMRACGAC